MTREDQDFGWFKFSAAFLVISLSFYPTSEARFHVDPTQQYHLQPEGSDDHLPGLDTGMICQEALPLSQKRNFYEGLAVLAKSNLESFFLPENRKRLHSQLLDKVTLPHQPALWFVPASPSTLVPTNFEQLPEETYSLKDEMRRVAEARALNLEELSAEQLEHQLIMERELHRKLFNIHQDNLDEYQDWAFHSLTPMNAYQRIFENYVSSSVWWNHYVVDYATAVAAILKEQESRMGCIQMEATLWAQAGSAHPKEN